MNIGSAHAGACFVRVGRCRLGSILGSILESFWGPSSPLYSFLVDLGCKLVEKKGSQQKDRKKVHQGNPSNPEEGGGSLKSIQSGDPQTHHPPSNTPLRAWGHGGGYTKTPGQPPQRTLCHKHIAHPITKTLFAAPRQPGPPPPLGAGGVRP